MKYRIRNHFWKRLVLLHYFCEMKLKWLNCWAGFEFPHNLCVPFQRSILCPHPLKHVPHHLMFQGHTSEKSRSRTSMCIQKVHTYNIFKACHDRHNSKWRFWNNTQCQVRKSSFSYFHVFTSFEGSQGPL